MIVKIHLTVILFNRPPIGKRSINFKSDIGRKHTLVVNIERNRQYKIAPIQG